LVGNDAGIVAVTRLLMTFDTSGDGVLDMKELPDALRFAGICPTQKDMEIITSLFDTNSK